MTQNRKRTRSVPDETEFMPLSKRINNLHINNMLTESNSANPEWFRQVSNNNQSLPESPNKHHTEWNCPINYSPDLDETQNPHYFNINKLLYEMYLQRTTRGCSQT